MSRSCGKKGEGRGECVWLDMLLRLFVCLAFYEHNYIFKDTLVSLGCVGKNCFVAFRDPNLQPRSIQYKDTLSWSLLVNIQV